MNQAFFTELKIDTYLESHWIQLHGVDEVLKELIERAFIRPNNTTYYYYRPGCAVRLAVRLVPTCSSRVLQRSISVSLQKMPVESRHSRSIIASLSVMRDNCLATSERLLDSSDDSGGVAVSLCAAGLCRILVKQDEKSEPFLTCKFPVLYQVRLFMRGARSPSVWQMYQTVSDLPSHQHLFHGLPGYSA
jgi:hypothetical protein